MSSESRFPKDALGFTFGSRPEEAEALCGSQGHQWGGEGDTYECSGAGVNVGVPVATELFYCEGALCEIRAYVMLSRDASGSSKFGKLRAGLTKQYGTPIDDQTLIPQSCSDKLMDCIVDGQAKWKATWEWEDGSRILAKTGTDGTSPIIGIRYSSDIAGSHNTDNKGEISPNSLNAEAF